MERSIVNAERQPILYSFALGKHLGNKTIERSNVKFYQEILESVLKKVRFYVEEDENNRVNFNCETLTFYHIIKNSSTNSPMSIHFTLYKNLHTLWF